MRQQAASLDEQIKRLEKERETIHSEQNRIRENLQSLGDRPAEKELRERFVRTLNTQEDRLEQIEREWQQKNTERDGCREQINVLLSGLEYEAEVSSF
jgi:chromosome segregation ATPase